MHQHSKILLKSERSWDIMIFFNSPDGHWPPCWIFKSAKFYLLRGSGWLRHVTMPNFVETGTSIAEILWFFRISNVSTATILDFQNHKILLADGVQRAWMHHRAKFHHNRSICWAEILRFFKMVDIRHLGSCLGLIWTTHEEYVVCSIIAQNLVMIK